MPLRHVSDDEIIEVVVDAEFCGDLFGLAKKRIVYIVDTPGNKDAIDLCWRSEDKDRCEIYRYPVEDPNDLNGNLLNILDNIDIHYYPCPGFVVHGIDAVDSLVRSLAEKGVLIANKIDKGFVAFVKEDAPTPGAWAVIKFLEKEEKG